MPSYAMRLILILWVLVSGSWAFAQKVNFDLGAYTINAQTPSGTSGSDIHLSTFGAYSVSANFELKPPVEIGVGYTVFYAKTLSGDMGFGPDFYLYYFPLASGSALKIETPKVQYYEVEQWRPFVTAAFHQRQFQSVQSAYSGFGLGLGTEWQWKEKTALRALVRSISMSGPSNAKLTYMDFLFGFQLQF